MSALLNGKGIDTSFINTRGINALAIFTSRQALSRFTAGRHRRRRTAPSSELVRTERCDKLAQNGDNFIS